MAPWTSVMGPPAVVKRRRNGRTRAVSPGSLQHCSNADFELLAAPTLPAHGAPAWPFAPCNNGVLTRSGLADPHEDSLTDDSAHAVNLG